MKTTLWIESFMMLVFAMILGCGSQHEASTNINNDNSGSALDTLTTIPLSHDIVMKIVSREASRLGYDMQGKSVTIFETTWDSLLIWNNIFREDSTYEKVLSGKRFWFFFARPPDNSLGGDFEVFIDSRSGKILSEIKGK
jgi:hypothetical protein